MRMILLSLILATAVLPAHSLSGQGMQLKTPNPDATAADADWVVNNQPIVAAGLTYYPTRETRIFDGQVMTQVDVYQNVPVYADMTQAPFELVYVPLTRTRLRTYERPADGDRWVISGRGRLEPRPVATTGSLIVAPVVVEAPIAARPAAGVESIPRPRGTSGIWVEFNGARWYNDGAAQLYTPDRFVRAGDYRGFAVYRDRGRAADRIWITTVHDGLLAPYRKR